MRFELRGCVSASLPRLAPVSVGAYVAWLEARATNDDGNIDSVAQESLRRGWYLGEETLRDRLLSLVDKAKGIKMRVSRKADDLEKDYSEKDAEQIIQRHGPALASNETRSKAVKSVRIGLMVAGEKGNSL